MTCEEVQERLSDLLDRSLDSERARQIQEHLLACSLCNAEMAGLVEYQQLVSTLPVIEPPAGFTARVMAEVRETAQPTTLWERLFLPLRIKVPLQATAVVLIAFLAAYIYQKQPPQPGSVVSSQPANSFRKQEEIDKLAPPVVPAPATGSETMEITEKTKPHVQKFKDSSQLKEPQSLSHLEERNKGSASGRSDAVIAPAPSEEKSSARSETGSPSVDQSSIAGNAPKAVSPAERLSLDAGEKRVVPSMNALRSGTVADIALAADRELVIRLKEPARDDKVAGDRLASDRARPERQLSALEEEANNVGQARQRAIQTGQAQTVQVTIPANQYELFKKELGALGNIDLETPTPGSEKNDAVAKSLDRLRIKVVILPPLSSGNSVPSQPSGR